MSEGIGKERKLDLVLTSFISELAHYLLAAGVGCSRFESIVRLAYFRAAAANARFSNEKLNQSAVAAMTGLTRTQVRALARQNAAAQPLVVKDRLEQVLDGWMTDPRFSLSHSVPRKLRSSGRGNTFAALARKYGGDVPARSLLREMHRQGYVASSGGYVSMRKKARETYEEARVRRITEALKGLVAYTESAQPPVLARTLNSETTYKASSEKGRHLMNRIAASRLHEFLEGLSTAGNVVAMEAPVQSRDRARVVRTRVVVISEEIEQEQGK